jgi:cytosine/adenosine deaminase-related metal-dependent hydrolase
VVAVGDVCNRLSAVDGLGAVPLLGCVFHEVFGMRKDIAEVMLGLAQKERAERKTWPGNLRYCLAPHTAYTLHPDVLRGIVTQARQSGPRTSLHLAEHSAERAFLQDGGGPFAEWVVKRQASALDWRAPGCDPVAYADQLSALGTHVIAVHLCDARPDELALVAQRGAHVVLCPRSNLHIEVKLPPLLDILRVGIKPALGTDSLSSNASLDPLAEARALHKRFPTVAPALLLAMATAFGADVLGFSHLVGRIRVGLVPGILAFEHGASVPAEPERFVLDNEKAPRTLVSQPAFQRMSLSSEVHA